jgi:hypothetical protein
MQLSDVPFSLFFWCLCARLKKERKRAQEAKEQSVEQAWTIDDVR